MRLATLVCALAWLAAALPAEAQAHFELPDTTLSDEPIRIVLRSAPPSTYVTVRLAVARQRSHGTFLSDRAGTVDLSRDGPVTGTYGGVEPMGLFWSARVEETLQGAALPTMRALASRQAPMPFVLTAEANGAVIATDTLWRRPVAAGVKITEIRDAGFTATLYEPPVAERRPAIVTLAGSQGGRMVAMNYPGGLASRGYVVLSLAYFGDTGVRQRLSNLPLEYFEHAIQWLRARPQVDSTRIGLLGGSKGAEAALLVASTYPTLIRAVVALVPGSVVWPGCCDSVSALGPSFTVGGKPLPYMPPEPALASTLTAISRDGPVRGAPLFLHRLADTAAVARAVIPVERIRGAVLLISSTDDGQWPSTFMAEQIMARLRAHGFRYPYSHIANEGAGHPMGRPYLSVVIPDTPNPATGRRNENGGTPAATQRARERAWAAMLEFFDTNLRR